ncbi:MAG TPA: hypothetical protein PKX27_08670 [Bacteroidales bacterium]|jgi:hypothetical protein|nr:hypothetical protein [Bacteroidales bacterium]HOX75308.1 hypothetical protein [Bacteroidales bacterium]HPM88043.1 hypothetical protein [Bacteroidales bacterium]HQM69752.1 hypothetical protein [Bacteroidales bacterium]
MKKTIAALLLPLLLAGFVIITSNTSCRNRGTGEQKKIDMNEADTILNQIEKKVYPLPTSAEVIKMLTDLEVGYIFGISNPVENSKKYIKSTDRAINLGGYGADLSYATLYNMQQEVLNYLSALRSLANELNMSQIYDESWYEKIRKNFDNRDELVKILTEAFQSTYAYLVENNQETLALLVVGGAWVEGMYLTTHVSEAAYQVAGISRNLLEQKEAFNTFLEVTKPYENEEDISNFLAILEPIKKVYEGLGTSLTQQNIIDITKAIEGIRAQIIK